MNTMFPSITYRCPEREFYQKPSSRLKLPSCDYWFAENELKCQQPDPGNGNHARSRNFGNPWDLAILQKMKGEPIEVYCYSEDNLEASIHLQQ